MKRKERMHKSQVRIAWPLELSHPKNEVAEFVTLGRKEGKGKTKKG